LLLLKHYFLISPIVVLIAISFFFHLGFIIKSLLMFIYLIAIIIIKSLCIDNEPQYNDSKSLELYLFCVIIIVCIYYRDRYMERTARSHFLWKAKLRVEQDDVETMGGINKILLENILPQHVAQHFLLSNCGRNDALYHERCVSNISFQTMLFLSSWVSIIVCNHALHRL
jgi:adenylate cyclase 2